MLFSVSNRGKGVDDGFIRKNSLLLFSSEFKKLVEWAPPYEYEINGEEKKWRGCEALVPVFISV